MFEIKILEDNKVNARDVWKELEVNHEFNHWIKNIIRDYGFKEDEDFSYFYTKSPIGRPNKDYLITFDTAKELCMISKTPKSRKVRKYFIEAEKKIEIDLF